VFALTLPPSATTDLSAAFLLFNLRMISFSLAAIYAARILMIPGIVAFAKKIAAENRKKLKQSAVIGTNGSRNK
jgi:predicted membrane protein